jgi:hypothetical protein
MDLPANFSLPPVPAHRRRWAYFDLTTGLQVGHFIEGTEEDAIANAPPNSRAIPDVPHPHAKRLVDGVLVDYQPPAPSPDHEWNDAEKEWRLSAAAKRTMQERNAALSQINVLEQSQARALRELALGDETARDRLTVIDEQIAALRPKLRAGGSG